jgi:23S rRNA (uracil1939-C5)-methyltransferase
MTRRRAAEVPAEHLDVEIESLSHDGRGVGRVAGKTVFVRDALPGESVRVALTRRRKSHDEGRLASLLRAAPQRVEPGCAHFGICGGCTLQHLAPQDQVAFKQQGLVDALTRIGGVTPDELAPPLTGEIWGYRRKARLGVKLVRRHDRVFAGFRERGSSFITDVRSCPVLHPRVGEAVGALADMIDTLSVRDRIPQVEMAMGNDLCVMVFRVLAPTTAADDETIMAFCAAHDWVPCIQEGGPDTIRNLAGTPVELHYSLPVYALRFGFAPTDFTQVNLDINRLMINQAMAWLAPQPDEAVLDLFCGLGNFTLPLGKSAASVVGVEGDAALVARARQNAAINRIDNARFFTADLFGSLDAEPWLQQAYDAVLLDPPRSGAAEVLPVVARLGVRRILYISCYPATLARDAGILVNEQGYRLARAGVMDMFPHTAHVESMALFIKS